MILGMKIIPDMPGSGTGETVDYKGAFLFTASLAGAAFTINRVRDLGLESPFILPFYLQVLRGYRADISGLILMAPPVAMMLIASFAGSYADRHGTKGICAGSSVLCVISFLLFRTIDGFTPLPLVIAYTLLMGTSITMFISPNMSFIMGKCPEQRTGIGSSLTMGMRYMGSMLGVASFGAVYSAYAPQASGNASGGIAASYAMVTAFHSTFALGILFGILMLIFTVKSQWRWCYICQDQKRAIILF